MKSSSILGSCFGYEEIWVDVGTNSGKFLFEKYLGVAK